MKRIFALLALATVAASASVTAAQAQVVTNETVSYHFSGYVPCANGGAGELVNGTIDAHDLVTSTVNANHESWQFQFQPRGSLVGSVTGDTYRLTGLTRSITTDGLQNDKSTLTYVNNYKLIGPGPGNNLRVRELAHVTRDGDNVIVRHDSFTIECT